MLGKRMKSHEVIKQKQPLPPQCRRNAQRRKRRKLIDPQIPLQPLQLRHGFAAIAHPAQGIAAGRANAQQAQAVPFGF